MPAIERTRSEQLRDWVAEALGGSVTEWRRLTSGNSRSTWSATVTGRDVVVRAEVGDGPFSGTELSLAREATLYRALGATGVQLAPLLAVAPGGDAIVTARLEGEPSWGPRELDDLLAELARLHRLDPAGLDLPGFARTPADDLELWARIARARITPPSPLVDFAVEFLRRHDPGPPPRAVLCHGDCGPANFLHDGQRLTGLLDWEFAHVGDPHDDLAWITIRALLFGAEAEGFARGAREIYAPPAGIELDEQRLRYWQAVVLLRNLITCLCSVANPVRGRDRLVHQMLIPPLQVLLTVALQRIAGLPAPAVLPPVEAQALPGLDVLADIADALPAVVAAVTEPSARATAKRARALLGDLASTMALAPAIAAADAREGPADDEAGRLGQLARSARRRQQLFPRTASMASAVPVGFG